MMVMRHDQKREHEAIHNNADSDDDDDNIDGNTNDEDDDNLNFSQSRFDFLRNLP